MKALLTQSEKEILFKEFEESGKTYAQFSAEKGLNLKTFSKWIYEWHRQNKEIDEVKFVQIKTTAISTPKEIKVSISFLINLKNRCNILMLTDLKCVSILSLPYRKKTKRI